MTQDELDLVPVDDLVAALFRRYDSAIFGATKARTTEMVDFAWRWTGRVFDGIAVAQMISHELERAVRKAAAQSTEGP